MKKQLYSFTLSLGLLLGGCELALSPQPAPVTQSSTALAVTASTSAPPTKPAASSPVTKASGTAPSPSAPGSAILKDPALYGPGNPKTHPAVPVARDLSRLKDKTRKENEKYRDIFESYLKQHFAEYEFRVVDIMDYQEGGKTYKKCRAYAAQSVDTAMDLLFDGEQVTDSFEQDVIGRRNTMNRWRTEFRDLLAPVAKKAQADAVVSPDVSYDYYRENPPLILLDGALDPGSTQFRRSLELYVQRGENDPAKISGAVQAVYQAVLAKGYSFQDYYIYLEDEAGLKTTLQMPLRLIGSQTLPLELQKALMKDDPGNLIQRVERPEPQSP